MTYCLSIFQFEFRISGGIKKKPILAANDPGRSQAIGPFVDPDPKFVLGRVGSSHTLELSMYCVHRPSLILHTNEYHPQTEPLDLSDFAAVLAVMNVMETEQLVLYNCGESAGASQGHKHMQFLPKPEIDLFPDTDQLLDNGLNVESWSVPGVPFKHFAMRFPPQSTATHLLLRYQRLLEKTTEALRNASAKIAYDVVIKRPWMLLVPRTHARYKDGRGPTNGAGMVGLVWVADQAERDDWTRLGMSDHLAYLGLPV